MQETGFTKLAVEILDLAHLRANSYGNLEISDYHVLAVLIEDHDAQLQGVISTLGIERAKALRTFDLANRGLGRHANAGRKFSFSMTKALESALNRAREENRHAGKLDLLYGILSTCNRLGALFNTLGLKPELDVTDAFCGVKQNGN